MPFQPRISTLEGAHKFWSRYGIEITHDDALDIYCAQFKDAQSKPKQAKTLTQLWYDLGDALIAKSR